MTTIISNFIKQLLLLLFILTFTESLPAIDMPVGIPTPPFGITNTHWMYHPNLGSKTWDYGSGAVPYRTNEYGPFVYYVDNTDGDATDTGNTYGTMDTPRLTWPFPLAAGAVVMVANGGAYTFNNGASSTMRHGGTGTEADPIFIIGVGATTNVSDHPKIDGKTALIQGTWTIFEGFVLTNNAALTTRNDLYATPITNYCVRSNICIGTGAQSSTTVFSVSSAGVSTYVENLVVFTNYVANYGNYTNTTENDATAVIFRDYSTNCWMLYNTVTRMGGDMIRVGSNEDNDLDNCRTGYHYIGCNQTFQNGENAVDVKKAWKVVCSENIFRDFHGYVPSGGDSAVSIHYNPNYVWFLNNHIYDGILAVSTGSRMQDTNQVWMIGNVMNGFSDSGVYWRGSFTNHLYGNTIYDAVNGIRISTSGNGVHLIMTNNIVVSSSAFNLTVPNSIARGRTFAGHEDYWNSGGALINWGTTYDVSDWIANTTTGDDSIEQDPLFVNAATDDFRLSTADGPCVGTGDSTIWSTIEATFFDQFGFALNYMDRSGNVRVNDIGAYEYSPGGGSTHTIKGARSIIINQYH